MPDREALSRESAPDGVPFIDGPFEGAHYPRRKAVPASIVAEGDGVPDGMVARYRYSRTHHGYVFKGLEAVVVRVARDG